MTEVYVGESILPKPAKGIPAGMDHSQRGCGDIRYDQTEVLSPNATVYVQGAKTIKDGGPAGGYCMDNQLLVQSSSCRLHLQWIGATVGVAEKEMKGIGWREFP